MSLALPRCALLLCVAGCATAPPAPKAGGAALTLSLKVDALPAGALVPRPIARGETLRSGDGVALSIQVDRAAYLYAVHYSRAGWSQLLFPTAKEEPQGPGPLRVPVEGTRLTLDDEPGEETFVVIASTRPILEADPGFCGRLRLHCPDEKTVAQRGAGQSPPPPPPPPPPLGVDPRDRSGADGPTEAAQADARGVAELRFGLKHATRQP